LEATPQGVPRSRTSPGRLPRRNRVTPQATPRSSSQLLMRPRQNLATKAVWCRWKGFPTFVVAATKVGRGELEGWGRGARDGAGDVARDVARVGTWWFLSINVGALRALCSGAILVAEKACGRRLRGKRRGGQTACGERRAAGGFAAAGSMSQPAAGILLSPGPRLLHAAATKS